MRGEPNGATKTKLLVGDLTEISRKDPPHIGALFLTEWGNMRTPIDLEFAKGASEGKMHTFPAMHDHAEQLVDCGDSRTFFEKLLDHLGLCHIKPCAQPPYIALVNTDRWSIEYAGKDRRFCDVMQQFGQHVIQQMKDSGAAQPAGCKVRALSLHIPSSMATDEREMH